MDSFTVLDYALFQLTPTRTRCDLVLFYGSKNEKLASGLFEPFISHLKFIKDQISKGGYSIKLCLPSNNAPWFTKGTFERFVRFVSTPAVLERFVSLENEIQQIESSVQANELPNTALVGQPEDESELAASALARKSSDSTKLKGELEGSEDSAPEQNSKIQLQRLLETRKILLCKEQAMAYACGLVAGFEAENIDDLISFADAFGASRLREACINFRELCKKKHSDGLWMQELAAMQACPPSELALMGTSGIMLTNDSVLNQNISLNELLDPSRSVATTNDASTDNKKDPNAKIQAPTLRPNQMPPYMYNFHNPMQQLPPFQGYPFSPMQPLPPHYSGQMFCPPGMKEPGSIKKEKSRKGTESLEEDITDSSGSEVESDSGSYVQPDEKLSSGDTPSRKKHRRKSSKTVVIRNINYITPDRRNRDKDGNSDESFSDEDEFIDEDSFKQQVEEAVGSLGKLRKSKTSKHGKKGSHKENHIANGSVEHDEDFDNTSISNGSKGGKVNDNWEAFQSLLMRDEETTVTDKLPPQDLQNYHFKERSYGNETLSGINPAIDAELQKASKQLLPAGDAFIVNQIEVGHENRVLPEDIENSEKSRLIMRRRESADEDLVISRRLGESGTGIGGILATESSTIRPGKGEDWFVIDHNGNNGATNRTLFTDDYMLPSENHSSNAEKCKKDELIDDSFVVHARPAVDESFECKWRTDVSMEADLTLSSKPESENVHDEVQNAYEPNDLCMVLERDSVLESVRNSWTSELGFDISFMETEKRNSSVNNCDCADPPNNDNATVKKADSNGKKVLTRDARSRGSYSSPLKSKTHMMSRTKKPSSVSKATVQKSKLEKEEEMRKKMEELAIQRQKRIAERTAAAGLGQATARKVAPAKGTVKSNSTTTYKTTSVKARAT